MSINSIEAKKKALRPRQLRLLENLLAGKQYREALEDAGYQASSRSVVMSVMELYKEIVANKAKKLAESSMSKDECIEQLRYIALNSKDENTRIKAMALVGKFSGYDAPIVTKNENINTTELRIMADDGIKNDPT